MNTHYRSASRRLFAAVRCVSSVGVLLMLAAGLLLVGCDSGGGMGAASVEMSGQVTDDQSSGNPSTATNNLKTQTAGVEGAVVTATSVRTDGSTSALEGEATTEADGSFTVTATGEGSRGLVRLNADGSSTDFSSSALVLVNGRSSVQTQPVTAETNAEADVYVEAKAEGEANSHVQGVTVADVALYVNDTTAADINAGATSAGEVASALAASVNAETSTNAEAESGASADALAQGKINAFAQLQSELATASSADARAQAVTSFENTMGTLYTEAGASAESQAESRQAGTSVMIEFSGSASSDAAFGLRKHAELLRAEATARAQEAILEAQGASDATISTLEDARATLKSDIRAATTVDAIVSAKSDYEAEVKAQMEATFDVSAATISSAESSIEGSVSTLFTTLSEISDLLGSASETAVDAYGTFYSSAQADATASFSSSLDSEAEAEAAAEALVYLSAFSEAN
jgi:hypothetical protein